MRRFEEYTCGCVSKLGVRKNLLGYCPKHGADMRYVHSAEKPADEAMVKTIAANHAKSEAKVS